jgi:hypothetical protein
VPLTNSERKQKVETIILKIPFGGETERYETVTGGWKGIRHGGRIAPGH